MHLDRDLNCLFQCCYKFRCLIRAKQTCHIFYTDRISAHFLDSLRKIHPVLQCICITECVGHCHLGMCFFFLCRRNCCLQVTDIIHTVKNTDDIDSVCDRFLYEILYHVIGIRTISEDVLSTEQHLQFCVFESVAEFTKSFPRIFFQET